jgi:hypothetical protein
LRTIDHHAPRAQVTELRYRPSSMRKEPSLSRELAPTESLPEPPQAPTLLSPPPPPTTEPMPSASFGASEGVDASGREVALCDVCDVALPATDDDDDVGGHGLYVWVRHGQVVYEEPPLCAACASAITLSALRRWDLEEEEG